ncbi:MULTISPECIES: MerR family transcriptional regulator [Priestia]|jgi:DNA-binding transcriptional MerR regulator|uniref:MerR family DNA-binding transcriptional regulator n=2 Tax=Priestia TaxID=2800373 RepID=A0A6M6DUJ6_PRIMG|nr:MULTISPECIES: MerR family transcriptional regulator [Priestia]MCJ7990042.1 MerR family transcriptional regulator [Priestia sp. OVS21]MDH3157093.1 MerR family transcriptional regulator [Priestia megaterium]MED4112507.1 MerR family transcriptional regulator [Priestia megaterium]QJX76359.1 MerR family DNA-binding transcriptional regulator [Priestia megaterium]WEA42839.1 MerR family transcriptional regulator [Priestia aryabhattai]
MENLFSIQQVASMTGLSTHTLRYYEKIGLIKNVQRDQTGYRQYTDFDLAWIQFLIRLRVTGMPMLKMKQFSDLRQKGESTITARKELLEEHYKDVLGKIEELELNSQRIEEKIAHYKKLETVENQQS